MKLGLTVVQLTSALLLTILVLLQTKGTGLGRTFGSTTYHSKRGMEHIVFRLTIFTATTFVLVSAINQLFI